MKISFEGYLEEIYLAEVDGTEDQPPNDDAAYDWFCEWMDDLDTETLIKHADNWAKGLLMLQLATNQAEFRIAIMKVFEEKSHGKV